ncbi:MAG: 3-dehydroquinate synthase [Dehalococcoidia bacterium]|nr:3-dehydroquinate synthase [Chloroflexi bacterium CFX7]MCK6564549.1 3-dehydroquinate synthase [Dehalococcoidia bacterium]NUQ56230.1 3-dehydroquinate synthase [Dehalococcoidia bacterium]
MSGERIFLIGLSGSGKSTVARLVARELGWDSADTDRLVEAVAGKPVAEVFAAEGEPRFREREVEALEIVARRERIVVATGGGAPTTPAGRLALARGFVVWLKVTPRQAAERLEAQDNGEVRPLLQGDAGSRLEEQLEARRALYELADATVDVDARSPGQVAAEVARLWRESSPGEPHGRLAIAGPLPGHGEPAAIVRTAAPPANYPVLVRRGLLASLGEVCRDSGLNGRAFVLTDAEVGPLFGSAAAASLARAGFSTVAITIPAGELHKNHTTLQHVYDCMLKERIERTDFAVCLGGGVVTDLGGFAAATVLRGIPFVHVPTTMLAMVDAAIGGKVAIDHSLGKNMIGAFAQPQAVVIDPAVLDTLPGREVRAGWAELIKHGLILDEQLVSELEARAGSPGSLAAEDLIARSVAIKAAVVSEDERESGRRSLLNYGHTIGHAIEAVTGYGTYLHGEAVAVGMHAAGLISVELGMLDAQSLERQQSLLRAYGLPERAPGADPGAVLQATRSDKKVREGRVRWVLLSRIGQAVIRAGVPGDVVTRAVTSVLR